MNPEHLVAAVSFTPFKKREEEIETSRFRLAQDCYKRVKIFRELF